MIEGSNCGSHVFDFFIGSSNLYVSKLYDFADAVEASEPLLATQLRQFAQAQAGKVLDLVRTWPLAAESLEYTKGFADGIQRSA